MNQLSPSLSSLLSTYPQTAPPKFIKGDIAHRIQEQSREEMRVYSNDVVTHRVAPTSSKSPRRGGGTRGNITGFSAKSRRSLLFQLRNRPKAWRCMVTLTYGQQWPSDSQTCSKHRGTLIKALKRKGIGGIWRLEFQKRGAPHLHLLLNKRVDVQYLRETWERIAGVFAGQVNVLYKFKPFYLAKLEVVSTDQRPYEGKRWDVFGLEKLEPDCVTTGTPQELAPIHRAMRNHQRAVVRVVRAQGTKPRAKYRSKSLGRRTYVGESVIAKRMLTSCQASRAGNASLDIALSPWDEKKFWIRLAQL